MRKRFLSLLLALVLVFSMIPAITPTVLAQSPTAVVYIPLDNRPFNLDRVVLMAESLNIELIMPPEELYATALDGQPEHADGTRHGDRGALLQWLRQQDETYDTFILSLDQLLSGGLMSSRCMEQNEDILLPDGTTVTELQLLDYLAELSENNTLYLIDSVMRIACNSGFGGYSLDHYMALMAYGRVARPELTGDQLTIDNIVSNYRLAASGEPAYKLSGLSEEQVALIMRGLESGSLGQGSYVWEEAFLERADPLLTVSIPVVAASRYEIEESENSVLSRYLSARERKLRLSDYAMGLLCGRETVHYLLGVDDSYGKANIQTSEIALLRQYLGENDYLFSALDGLAQAALAHLYGDGSTIAVNVTYYGDQRDTVLPFNYTTPGEMVSQALRFFGCQETEGQGDISVLVYTSSHLQEDWEKAVCELTDLMNRNEADGIPTILVDLAVNTDKDFNQMLLHNVSLSMLLSYSGRPEIPNCVVMAMSQGVARYRSLLTGDLSETQQTAHLQNLTTALLSKFVYADVVQDQMSDYLSRKGLSPTNFYTGDAATIDAVSQELCARLTAAGETLFSNLLDGPFIASLAPYTRFGFSGLSIREADYPWYRNMEFSCVLSAEYAEAFTGSCTFHQGFIHGMTDHTFQPTENLTREQGTKLLLESQGIASTNDASDFQDVSPWAQPFVAEAQLRGYIHGYPDGSFRGSNVISRAEFATMILNYVETEGLSLPTTREITFSDVEKPDQEDAPWYAEAVYALAEAELVNGYPDGTFLPDNPIRRVEAVAIFNRLLGRNEDVSSLSVPRFSDVSDPWMLAVLQEAAISHFE